MDVYRKNLEALSKTHPHLVQLVEETEIDKNKITVSRSEGDQLQIVYRKADGKRVAIVDTSSQIDTAQFPKRVQDLLEDGNKPFVMLLFGFGLGGYPEGLLHTIEKKGFLVVYEAVPELFKIAIKEKDLSHILESERLELFLGEQREGFSFIRKYHRDIRTGRSYILQQSACVDLKQDAYDNLRKELLKEKRIADMNVNTGISRGGEWLDAFLENIPTILRTPGVTNLRGIFQGRPAIIVSAGPSLEKNFHLLQEAKGKAIIIAVDVVTPTLLSAGIFPDVIIAIESNRKLHLAFQNNPLLRLTPLVCSGEVNNETMMALYPGPLFLSLLPHHLGYQWLQRHWEAKGFITQFGGSVAHSAFAFAEMIGAGPIALMGQDLSFQEKLHAGDVTGLFYKDDEIEGYRKKNPVVTDIFGEKRHTMHQFLAFRAAFEKHIEPLTIEVFNATEGGLPIEGVKNMRLKDFIEDYCNIPSIDYCKMLDDQSEASTKYDLAGLLHHITDNTSKLRTAIKSAKKIIDCVLRLKELKEGNLLQTSEAVKLVRTIERHEKKANDPVVRLVGPYRYKMANYLRRNEIGDDNIDMIQDGLDYYTPLIEVMERFLMKTDALVRSLEREQDIDDILEDASRPVIEKYFQAGMIHKNAGMVRQAVKEFEKAAMEFTSLSDPEDQIKYWPMSLQVHFILAELYIKQYRFYDAKEVLEVLRTLSAGDAQENQIEWPDQKTVMGLLKTCNEKIIEWEKKEARAGSLLDKARANYGSHLESGSFYFKIGEIKRAEQAYAKAIEEARFLLLDDHSAEQEIVVSHKIRLVGAYYGLAQVYAELQKRKEAIETLDQGRQEIESLLVFNIPEAFEGFSKLFIDLYLRLGERDKAMSLCERVLAGVPGGQTKHHEMIVLMEKETTQTPKACMNP